MSPSVFKKYRVGDFTSIATRAVKTIGGIRTGFVAVTNALPERLNVELTMDMPSVFLVELLPSGGC